MPQTLHTHGDRFMHYKSGVYEWLMEATLEADETLMVVYRQQATGRVFVRPASEFYGTTHTPNSPVPRFAKIVAAGRVS
jgi:hypothetical protein